MKNKMLVTILFIFQAIPIPFSLISVFGSIMSIANISMVENYLAVFIPIITMFLAATYTMTYAVSLFLTIKNKKIYIYSFLPILHLVLIILFFLLWLHQ